MRDRHIQNVVIFSGIMVYLFLPLLLFRGNFQPLMRLAHMGAENRVTHRAQGSQRWIRGLQPAFGCANISRSGTAGAPSGPRDVRFATWP
jgi:hypothetical protein